MKHVVDSNYLRDTSLKSFLVLTDYAAMEALKGDALLGMHESMRILSQFPSQVQVLKTTIVICGLSGASKGLQRRFVDVPLTDEFWLFCRNLSLAKSGSTTLTTQLNSLGEAAREHFNRLDTNAREFANSSVEAVKLFTKSERHQIINSHRYSECLLWKIFQHTIQLSAFLFRHHPSIKRIPSGNELINTYIFRSALCNLLLGFRYDSNGGVPSGKSHAKIRNDMVDVHFATYATFFDGLLSRDELTNWLFRMTKDMLSRFRTTYLH
jgi:hypothetical protein